jgi:phytanoyl-CoA hydroxylase
MLSPEQAAHFRDSGYVVLEGFKSDADLASIKQAAAAIAAEFVGSPHRSIFTTHADAETLDKYFLTSGDKIRCFLEEDGSSINKIGHALHDLDPTFDAFSRDPRLAALLKDLGVMDPQIWQSMYIYKNAYVGGEVSWHQDATYFSTEPQTVKTLWFAVDDARLDNGCLWAAKCGANTPLREVFRVDDGVAETVALDSTPWPSLSDAVPLEVSAGTLICFDGLLPHYSAANRSAHARHAYTLHVVDGVARYPSTNWIQRDSNLPVRGFD